MSQMRGELRRYCINGVGGHYGLPGRFVGKVKELDEHCNKLLGDSLFTFGGLNIEVSERCSLTILLL